MNVHDFDSYKSALRAIMKERQQQFGSRFTFEKMAAACGIQKTYLSKVMNSSAHLNSDQLYSACEYLKLCEPDFSFLSLLLELERSNHPKRSNFIKTKITKARNKHLKTESVLDIENKKIIFEQKWEYYTDIDLQLVHMFMTVPDFAKDPNSICSKIGIDDSYLHTILLKLESWKIIQFREGIYEVQNPKLHLSEDSPAFLAFGILNRIKTLEKLRKKNTTSNNDYFFSTTFSSSKSIQLKTKRKFLEFIKDLQNEVVESNAEDVYQINIDFFKWS